MDDTGGQGGIIDPPACCFICDVPVLSRRHREDQIWLRYFRAVYTAGHDTDNVRLSGLSSLPQTHEQQAPIFPPKPDQRYEDVTELQPHEGIQIYWMHPPCYASRYSSDSFYFGYIVHDRCWNLLGQAIAPLDIDMRVLYGILESTKRRNSRLSFDRDELPMRWDRIIKPGVCNPARVYQSPRDRTRDQEDPGDTSWIETLMERASRHRKAKRKGCNKRGTKSDDVISTTLAAKPASHDSFATLPTEVRLMIYMPLPSRDVANLRVASRVCAADALPRPFWASRFAPDPTKTCGLLVEADVLDRVRAAGLDIETLHAEVRKRLHNRSLLPHALANRARITRNTVAPLGRVLDVYQRRRRRRRGGSGAGARPAGVACLDMYAHGPEGSPWEPDATLDETEWCTVTRAVRQPSADGVSDCNSYYFRKVVFPAHRTLQAIHVSFVDFFGKEYVTGMRFAFGSPDMEDPKHAADVELGYVLMGHETAISLRNGGRGATNRDKVPTKPAVVTGFHIGLGVGGIQGIGVDVQRQVRSTRNTQAHDILWARRLDDPVSLVSKDGPIAQMAAHFDGFKMVGLSISKGPRFSNASRDVD